MRAVLDRVEAADYPAWKRQVERTGHCVAPVRVRGSAAAVDGATGEVRAEYSSADQPDGTLLVACGDRRAAVCPPCAARYRDDMWHLVAAGVRGRDGEAAVSDSVADHPRVFATLTAPSFGAVHRASDGACRPRATRTQCPNGRPAGCGLVHEAHHPVVGTPVCAECYDYTGAVLWNAHAGELWRRTTIAIGRELARAASGVLGYRVSAAALRDLLRVSYVKMAEFQKRGLVHFHIVARLDGVDPGDRSRVVAPPDWARPGLLADAVEAAAARVELALPAPDGVARVVCWGVQRDVADVTGGGWESGRKVARYLAKYATKTASESVGASGALARRLHGLHVRALRRSVGPHLARMVETAWRLGHRSELAHLRLHNWAHQLGFRGHFTTKSRGYSVTLGALRAVRRAWRQRQQAQRGGSDVWASVGAGTARVVGSWRYAGRGYVRGPDAHLVAAMAEEAAEARAEVRAQKRMEAEARFWGAMWCQAA